MTKDKSTPLNDKMWVTGIAIVACAGLAGSLAVKNAEANVEAQAARDTAATVQADAANRAAELEQYKAALDARAEQLKQYSEALAVTAQQMETFQAQYEANSPSGNVNVPPPVLKPEVIVQAPAVPAPAPQPQTTTKGS